MKKRWTAALLALILAATLLPGTAWAADLDSSAGGRLTGADRAVYEVLKAEVIKIANGRRTSTAIKIPDQPALSWTLAELGVTGSSRSNILEKLEDKFAQVLHMDLIYTCLSVDLPFEMYWKSNQFSWGYSFSRSGDRASVNNMTVYLQVAQSYRGGGDTTVSAAKAAAAKKAAENARAIVDKYRDKSDYEKLTAYRDEICRLVSYDMRAARNDSVPYGDPWQLVYVFDGDAKTNVVCEGYAKAFKYLCDLSDFHGDVACYTVSGYMDGGRHMWNVVRMDDGKNYLVDVTNCDSGMIGDGGQLFLSGAARTDGGQSWGISKGYCQAVYSYAEEQKDLFTDGYLALSSGDYVYDPNAAAAPAGGFVDVAEGQYYAGPVSWALEEGIAYGTSANTFSPAQTCTHAQILTFLWRAAGEPDADGGAPDGVKPEDYFYDAVRWAAGKGMLDGSFDPGAGCSRADAVRYIWLAFEGPGYQAAWRFTDVPPDSPYACAVGWALMKEITNGASDTTFEPDAICTRGQIVTFLYRAYH